MNDYDLVIIGPVGKNIECIRKNNCPKDGIVEKVSVEKISEDDPDYQR